MSSNYQDFFGFAAKRQQTSGFKRPVKKVRRHNPVEQFRKLIGPPMKKNKQIELYGRSLNAEQAERTPPSSPTTAFSLMKLEAGEILE